MRTGAGQAGFGLQFCAVRGQFPCPQAGGLQRRFRQGGKLRRRPHGSKAARLKKEIPVRHILHPGQPVLCQHNGHARALHGRDHIVQLHNGPGVQVAGGFVQHQQLRPQHTGGSKGHPLLFAAGKPEHTAVHQRFQVELLHHLLHPLPDGGRLHAAVLTGEGQLGGGVHIEILRFGVLEHAAHQRHILLNVRGTGQQPLHGAAAGQLAGVKRRGQAVQQAGKGGFSAAAAAAQQYTLAGPDVQCHVLQCRGGTALIGKRYMVAFDPAHSSITPFHSSGRVHRAG